MAEDRFNSETNGRHLVEKELRFAVRNHQVRIVLPVPFYIYEKLGALDYWPRIVHDISARCAEYFEDAARQGMIGDAAHPVVMKRLRIYANERTYELFGEIQQKLGNWEGWEVPKSLQQHTVH